MVTAAHGSWTEFQINIEKP